MENRSRSFDQQLLIHRSKDIINLARWGDPGPFDNELTGDHAIPEITWR